MAQLFDPKGVGDYTRRALQRMKEYVDTQDRYKICTSTTRPTGVAGLSIYETNTNRQLTHDGTGWVIMAEPTNLYTPSLSGVTLGNGAVAGRYHRCDGYVDFYARFDFGTTSAIGANPTIGLPIAYSSGQESEAFNVMYFNGARWSGRTLSASTTTVGLLVTNTAGTHSSDVNLTATIPFTWANGCALIVAGRYQMTTRYS